MKQQFDNHDERIRYYELMLERDLEGIFQAFAGDPLVTCGLADARKLFEEMCENTKAYLTMYGV